MTDQEAMIDCPHCGQDLRLPPDAYERLARLLEVERAAKKVLARLDQVDDMKANGEGRDAAMASESLDDDLAALRRLVGEEPKP